MSFKTDNHIIVYAGEKIIAYARNSPQIFGAQCVWWLASVIWLEPGLILNSNKLPGRGTVERIEQWKAMTPLGIWVDPGLVIEAAKGSKEERQDRVIKEREEYLKDSRRL